MVDVRGKKIYLSGPMTGLPNHNREAFARAENLLRDAGALRAFDPANYWGHTDKSRSWYMVSDLNELTSTCVAGDEYGAPWYDLLVSLPGWEGSEGARLERAVAEACGIECRDLSEVVGDAEDRL